MKGCGFKVSSIVRYKEWLYPPSGQKLYKVIRFPGQGVVLEDIEGERIRELNTPSLRKATPIEVAQWKMGL